MPKVRKARKNVKSSIVKVQANKKPIICHMITMKNMQVMGDISRQIYDLSYGDHIFCNIDNVPPKADIYLLECFINKHQKYIDFKKPYPDSKVISLIHSSCTCMPAKCSDKIITLTHGWQRVLKAKIGKDSVVIPAGIDTEIYNYPINYEGKTFGRITRWTGGKIHPEWNDFMKSILILHPDSRAIIISNNARKINAKRVLYIDDIKIHEHDKKARALSQMAVFADMHHTFQETFSLCLLEAMAAGCAYILYSTSPQPSMFEILGDAGIICLTVQEFKKKFVQLLLDTDMKREYGTRARNKAKLYSIDKMIQGYNRVFKGVLGEK